MFLTHESHLCTTKQQWKGGWCKGISNSHPKYKESVQKLDAKSRNSPGQCLGITKGLRTTGDYVASHKVSHQRSGLFPAAGRSEQPGTPWQRFGDPIKTRTGRAESGGRAPADHEHASLQLPQVDPHLGAVAGFPYPDLQERKGKKNGAGRWIRGEKGKTRSKQHRDKWTRCLGVGAELLRGHRSMRFIPSPSSPGICNLSRKWNKVSNFPSLTSCLKQSSRKMTLSSTIRKAGSSCDSSQQNRGTKLCLIKTESLKIHRS